MAKYLKLTDEVYDKHTNDFDAYIAKKRGEFETAVEKAREDFEKSLISGKTVDGKFGVKRTINFDFSVNADNVSEKAHITFTPTAWIKMHTIVATCDKEAAWNATAVRDPDTPNGYIIKDVFVYPQEVTGVTVDRDAGAYMEWLNKFPDDVFNEIRVQGHSHVNMPVSPSGTDIEHQQEILDQMSGDMFYIILIVNKDMDIYVKIVDLLSNLIFESADVTYSIQGFGLGEFLDEIKTNVKNRVPKSYGKPSGKTKKYTKSEKKYQELSDDDGPDDFYDKYNRLYPGTDAFSYGSGGYYGMFGGRY